MRAVSQSVWRKRALPAEMLPATSLKARRAGRLAAAPGRLLGGKGELRALRKAQKAGPLRPPTEVMAFTYPLPRQSHAAIDLGFALPQRVATLRQTTCSANMRCLVWPALPRTRSWALSTSRLPLMAATNQPCLSKRRCSTFNGVPKDEDLAERYLRRAALGGNTNADILLGLKLLNKPPSAAEAPRASNGSSLRTSKAANKVFTWWRSYPKISQKGVIDSGVADATDWSQRRPPRDPHVHAEDPTDGCPPPPVTVTPSPSTTRLAPATVTKIHDEVWVGD